MKKLLILFSILFLSYFGKSQGVQTLGVPTGTVNAKGSFLVDSLFVLPLRDTVFPPSYNASLRKTGAMVIKGTTPYYYNGTKWVGFQIGSPIDTTSLSNRINQKLSIADSNTAYITPTTLADTAFSIRNDFPSVTGFVQFSDSVTTFVTPTMLNDTASAIRGAIPSLTGYLLKSDSTIYATLYRLDTTRTALDARINLRLKISDSTTAYVTPTRLADTATVLRGLIPTVPTIYYQTIKRNGTPYTQQPTLDFSTQFALNDNIGTSATDVSVSALAQSVVTGLTDSLNARVRYVDTTPMLAPYLREVDTASLSSRINLKANIASPTFTGVVTIPTPFTLGATSVTSTGTQLNYLSSATGTTGTTSTNLVYSTSPTLVTPNLGTPSTLVGTNITGTASGLTSGITNALKSATTTVNVSSATAPTSGQVLTATSSTTATWQTSSGIPPQLEYNNTDKTVWCNGKLDYATNTNFGESTITQLSGFAFHNSAFGYTTMYGNTSGSYNTAFGSQSLYSNSTSLYNSAFGQTALYSATGGYNTAVGGAALYSIGAGIRNSGLGFQALNSVVGNYNVALGSNAGQNHSGGSMNLADNSIFIGYNAKAFANNQINQIVIGHDAVGLGSNTTVIGNNSTVNAKIWGALATGSINTGTTLNGTIFAKSANVLSLASTDHALTAGNESTGLNMAFGLYSTSLGIQARNNGTSANLFLQGDGGGVAVGNGALTGQRIFAVNNTGTGTGDYASIEVRNGSAGTDAIRLYMMGTNWTPSGIFQPDYGTLATGTGVSGLAIGTQGNVPFETWTNNTKRWVLDGAGNTIITGKFTSSGGGLGYSTGAGGTVTQATSKSTGVTLNKLSGQITMNNASLAANGEAVFTLTNSFIEATDVVVVCLGSSVSAGRYMVGVATVSAGSCQILITNLSSVASEAPVINFAVIKAVNN